MQTLSNKELLANIRKYKKLNCPTISKKNKDELLTISKNLKLDTTRAVKPVKPVKVKPVKPVKPVKVKSVKVKSVKVKSVKVKSVKVKSVKPSIKTLSSYKKMINRGGVKKVKEEKEEELSSAPSRRRQFGEEARENYINYLEGINSLYNNWVNSNIGELYNKYNNGRYRDIEINISKSLGKGKIKEKPLNDNLILYHFQNDFEDVLKRHGIEKLLSGIKKIVEYMLTQTTHAPYKYNSVTLTDKKINFPNVRPEELKLLTDSLNHYWKKKIY